ncbi:MAG: amidohydrolase family protein [Pseudomonadota bacterium]
MRQTIAATLLAAASLVGTACSDGTDADLLIRNVTVIDAVGGDQGPRDVGIRGARIAYVDAAGRAKRRAAAEVIDGSGRFLIPGLWDMHVHLTWPPDWRDPMLRLFTANGITSVRDTGGELGAVVAARQAARTADFAAPDVYISGPLLDGAAIVYDGSAPGYPPLGISLKTPLQARVAVATLDGARVDFVKAYEMLAPDVFAAVLAAAAERGLPVSAHVPLSVDAAAARANDLQHLRNVELACAEDHERLLAERRREWLELSADLEERTSRPDFMAWSRRTVQRYREFGGTLLAGTDTPLAFLTPGASLHRELRELVAAGLTPREALAAATSNAAGWFGRDGETGRIAPGLAADMVLLRADPLADIGNTETIDAVVRGGVCLDTDTLAAYRDAARERIDPAADSQ